MTQLRPYQEAAISETLAYWARGGGNPLVEMATGTGKSVVIAELLRRLLDTYPDMRVVMLTHVKELVHQNLQALLRQWPGAPVGINSAGLGRRDRHSQILFASIQSVFRLGPAEIRPRDLVLIDEAHLTPRKGEGMYLSFLENLRSAVPDLRVAGFTATPYRLDSGRLDRGEGRLFDRIVYTYGIGQAIDDNFLSPLISKATATAIDVSGVAKRGGEFVAAALEAAVDQDFITKAAVAELMTYGHDRKSWIIFASGVDHACHLRDEIRSHGVSCETVTGQTPKGDRDRIIRDFKAGKIRALTNAMVLTTGFDAPGVDLVAMLRPTLSTGLYVQCIGRGTRLAPGKDNCLVLDFAGNVRRHGPVDAIEVTGNSGGSGKGKVAVTEETVRAKACPECSELLPLGTYTCTVCGYEFPRPAPRHDAQADGEVSILSKGQPVWTSVHAVTFHHHRKQGGKPSLRVEYQTALAVYRTWVCFEHTGFAHDKAVKWWRKFGQGSVPGSVKEAIERQGEISPANEIAVKPAGKYFEIVSERRLVRKAAE